MPVVTGTIYGENRCVPSALSSTGRQTKNVAPLRSRARRRRTECDVQVHHGEECLCLLC